MAARDAFLAGDGFRLAGFVEKLRGFALEPYVVFWGLKLRLEQASAEEVRGFLQSHEGTVLAEQLRRDWLRILGRNGQWDLFRQELPLLVRADFEVDGYALQERWLRKDATATAELRSLWKAPRVLPQGCAPVIETLLQSGELTPRDLRDRFRMLIQAGLPGEAKRVAEKMPADQAPAASRIDDACAAPDAFLEKIGSGPKKASERELAVVALAGLARSDPQQAFRHWDSGLWRAFPPEDRQFLWAMLATYGARRHLPEALDWFARAGNAPLTDEQLFWYARIALRQGDWAKVREAIGRMSPAERAEPTWIYWLGRSLAALGAREEGKELWARIAGGHHFYGLLAAEELGMPLEIPPKAEPTPKEAAGVAAQGGIGRALVLYRLGLRTEGQAEWLWAVRAMDDRSLLAAAELARKNGIWDRAINTADRTVAEHDFTLRYLAPYGSLLGKQARQRNLDEALVLGLVRQESRFLAEAKSSAGALGLMQLMPATASRVAKQIGMKDYRPSRLGKPEVNAALGTAYLRHVLDGFGGSAVLAAAAYNAGPGRASRWRNSLKLEGAVYVESIPFSETRQYVKKVLANAVCYAAVLGLERRTLKSWLGVVDAARNGANGTEGLIE